MFPPKKPGKTPSAMGQVGYPSPMASLARAGAAPVVTTQSPPVLKAPPRFGRPGSQPKGGQFGKAGGKKAKGPFFTGNKHPVSGEPF